MTLQNIGNFIGWIFSMFGQVYNAIVHNWLLAVLLSFVLISGIVSLFLALVKNKRGRK